MQIPYEGTHLKLRIYVYSSIFVLYRRNMASVYYEAYSHQYLDSPNTTNQVDYQVYFYVNAHTGYFAMDPSSTNSAVIMLLQEIKQWVQNCEKH